MAAQTKKMSAGVYRGRTGEAAAQQTQVQFRIPAMLRLRLVNQAKRRHVSINLLIEHALEDSLDRWEKQRLP